MSENQALLAASALEKLTDDELKSLRFSMPWQTDEADPGYVDPDGFASASGTIDNREQLQQACWNKFNQNPQISTAVKGQVGRLTGSGFETSSEIPKIQDVIDETELDQRNRLYLFWPKYVGRSVIEGELFLCLSLHDDGFVEIDFIDPSDISGGGEDGIIYHPTKPTMPLFYYVQQSNANSNALTPPSPVLVPSTFVARYPELYAMAKKLPGFQDSFLDDSKSGKHIYKKLGGFRRFIVSWDKSFLTKRNVSHLRTILEWLNHYENLKKYEIDHKKSAGSYLWVVTMEDPKTFRTWLALSDEERRKTGIMAKKTPGSTMVLPPGMKLEVMNPSLPSISESDTDIFHMITSGLNEPEDVTSGQSKGTFSSVKASRGPMSDRMMDESTYFERFLRHDFWGSVFFLKSAISNFPPTFDQKVAVDFKDKEPVFKTIKKRPELLIDINFPTSEVNDAEAKARAYLGVKHGSTFDTLGIPNQEIARKMGFGNYRKLRLQQATEIERFPELAQAVDQAAITGDQNPKTNSGDPKGDQKNPDAKPVVKPTIKRRTDSKTQVPQGKK
jgi:hypothetical protein